MNLIDLEPKNILLSEDRITLFRFFKIQLYPSHTMSASELGVGSRIGHPKFGSGVIVSIDSTYYKIYFSASEEVKTLARDYEGFTVEEAKIPDFPMLTMKEVEKAIREALLATSERAPLVPLGGKWMGGNLVIEPGFEGIWENLTPVRKLYVIDLGSPAEGSD